ncbi:MAG: hypothetical protein ACE5E1_05000 [Phycisphaerae bacterium]
MIRRFVLVPLVAVFFLISPVGAQINETEDIKPDNVKRLKSERPILEYVCAGAFILGAMAVGFKPSKRSHD